MLKFLPLALHNLVRNRRRTILTISSIAVSLFVFCALLSMPTAVRLVLRERESSLRLITSNKGGLFYLLPAAYKRRIRSLPHVEAVAAENVFGGIYRDPHQQMPAAAIDPEELELIWPEWRVTADELAEFKRARRACLVSPGMMRKYRWHIGDDVSLKGTIYPVTVSVRIAGTIDPGNGRDAMLFRTDYLDELLGRPGRVNLFWVKVDGAGPLPMVSAAVDEMFANSSAETKSETEVAFIGQFLNAYRSFFRMSEMLGIIVVVVMGLVAANTAAMSIRERRSEIAVMRSIGFQSGTLVSLMLGESVILSVLGGLIGCAGAYAILNYVVPAAGSSVVIRMPARVMLYGVGVALATGIASAIMPALSAVRRTIVSGLRTGA